MAHGKQAKCHPETRTNSQFMVTTHIDVHVLLWIYSVLELCDDKQTVTPHNNNKKEDRKWRNAYSKAVNSQPETD